MASKSQSRNSSPKISVRRPKLLRASATAPSLATSNASRKDLASLHCQSSGAATLLTRMASSSSAQLSYEHTRAQRASVSSGSFCVRDGQQSPESAHMERKEPFEIVIQQCGNYYSFPSFEDFQEFHEGEERRRGRQENDVP